MTFGSLFSGVGGLDRGLEDAGMQCKWQVEIDEYARRVLAKHWPDVRRWDDVQTWPQPDTEPVDLICGGFPCQGTSNSGNRKGLEDERSGLWIEFDRIIRVLRPRIAIVENVGSLSVRGLGNVLGDLREGGFDAEWRTLSASLFGFPHKRERLFIIAYAAGDRLEGRKPKPGIMQGPIETLDIPRHRMHLSKPLGIRSTDGIPRFVDRIRGLGNAVVPQIGQWIGERIMEAANEGR